MYFIFFQIFKFIFCILNFIFDFDQINFRLGEPGLYKFKYPIIGYKKVCRCPKKFYKKGIYFKNYSDVVLEIEIPAGSKIMKLINRNVDEFYSDKVIIKDIITIKPYKNFKKNKHIYFSNDDITYEIGQIIELKSVDKNNFGIHFYKNIQDAI
ncbi:hypothetical protein ma263 [Moumouvirus australiensis]|uniref:Uncharacterized protein n=1 Tax=Moumouvirus australiensis TaxID=2109587 RepID=A0A2P1EL70_9VIRU|nr:hypothetical protein QKC55_gp641 [Moumouvirus australiensis]AVL94649.1 hypothetical protein ma263 [Moumouvirus australiensis]